MLRSGYKNMHQKAMCLREIEHVDVLTLFSQKKEEKKEEKKRD